MILILVLVMISVVHGFLTFTTKKGQIGNLRLMRQFGKRADIWSPPERPWQSVADFWRSIIAGDEELPEFLVGRDSGSEYGMTLLEGLHEAGYREYCSGDNRFDKQRNYAVTFAYVGEAYHGYQRQPGYLTVEDDLRLAIANRKPVVAGRTDRGVSAISQVINFSIARNCGLGAADMLASLRASPACADGRLRILDCRRVPKKFNARSQATWRRYVYIFPICLDLDKLDMPFLNELLGALENKELPYHAFSFGENRARGEGLEDRCTLYRASAEQITLPHGLPAVAIELVGSRFLRRMVRILCATALREAGAAASSWAMLDDDVELYSSADDSDGGGGGGDDDGDGKGEYASADEKEWGKSPQKRSRWVPGTRVSSRLVDILQEQDRFSAAPPLPAQGLALCGVGYDKADLAVYKTLPTNPLKLQALEERVCAMREAIKEGSWKE